MSQPRYNIAIVSSAGKFAPCIEYVFNLFGRVHGYNCHFVSSAGEASPDAAAVIQYGDGAAGGNGRPGLLIPSGEFFRENTPDGFGTAAVPGGFADLVSAAKGAGFSTLSRQTGVQNAALTVDVVAAAFYMLTGYYEWAAPQRDQHGRMLSSHVPVPPETWDLPVVNHWFRQLDELLQSLITGKAINTEPRYAPPATQTICLTHDVDLLRKYRPGKAAKGLLKAATSPGDLPRAFSDLRRAMTGNQPDPYDSFDALYMVKERISAPSTFFFLGSGPGGNNGDYHPNDRELRELFTRARTSRDEIALHGSWDSIDDCRRMASERATIEKSARVSVKGVRQHYLRFSNPETWNCADGAGLRYDSTGAFPDRAGFKYGWSGCYNVFDLDALEQLPLIEIPLTCMDVTLANYEKIPAELSLERLSSLLDAACDNVPGGAFVFLWHNIMADREEFPGYWDTFEYFFSVASGSARFVTLSQLCEEYGAGI